MIFVPNGTLINLLPAQVNRLKYRSVIIFRSFMRSDVEMPRGRPRKVDLESALETSMNVFWAKGFEATSMNDLSAATGMAKPGLYAAFGDKEQLFCKALTRYFSMSGQLVLDELVQSRGPLSADIRSYLDKIADSLLDKSKPNGCFLANSVVECADHTSPLAQLARDFDARRRQALFERLERARQIGELPEDAGIEALADFFAGQALAMAVMGRAGSDQATFERFIDVAMQALPCKEPPSRAIMARPPR
jgi:AcrR family transcriptional regulator